MPNGKFDRIKNISINNLLLDVTNPRIQEQPDERGCIEAILHGREGQMLKLMKDIAENGLYPEAIIVSPHPEYEKKWIVRDGNRRITALKLLHDPSKAPQAVRTQIQKIVSKFNNFPKVLDCETCKDEKYILRFLQIKHTGVNEGIGQIEWGPLAKATYNESIGNPDPNIKGLNLLRWASENGQISYDDDFKVTTLSGRVMTKDRLVRIGFDLIGDKVVLIKDLDTTLKKVRRIISDIASDVKTSRNLETSEQQNEYIEQLCLEYGEGTLLDLEDDNTEQHHYEENNLSENNNQSSDPKQNTSSDLPSMAVPPNPQDRKKLFYRGRVSFQIPQEQGKERKILSELAKINLYDNPIAAAMLMRSLIEMSTIYYFNKMQLTSKPEFASRVRKAAEKMYELGKIDKSKMDLINKRTNNIGDMLHMNTLHAYVHSPDFHPDYQRINAFWDEIEFYVRECWNN